MFRIYSPEEFSLLHRSVLRTQHPTRATPAQVAEVKARLTAPMTQTFPRTSAWIQGTARPQSADELLFESFEAFVRNAENSGLTCAQIGRAQPLLRSADDQELFHPGVCADGREIRRAADFDYGSALRLARVFTEKKGNFRTAALRQMEGVLQQLEAAAALLCTPQGQTALAEEFAAAVNTLQQAGVATLARGCGLSLSAQEEAELAPHFEAYVDRYEALLVNVLRAIQRDELGDLRGLMTGLKEDEGIGLAEWRIALERAGGAG